MRAIPVEGKMRAIPVEGGNDMGKSGSMRYGQSTIQSFFL